MLAARFACKPRALFIVQYGKYCFARWRSRNRTLPQLLPKHPFQFSAHFGPAVPRDASGCFKPGCLLASIAVCKLLHTVTCTAPYRLATTGRPGGILRPRWMQMASGATAAASQWWRPSGRRAIRSTCMPCYCCRCCWGLQPGRAEAPCMARLEGAEALLGARARGDHAQHVEAHRLGQRPVAARADRGAGQ